MFTIVKVQSLETALKNSNLGVAAVLELGLRAA
jgi:hypothetical protein